MAAATSSSWLSNMRPFVRFRVMIVILRGGWLSCELTPLRVRPAKS